MKLLTDFAIGILMTIADGTVVAAIVYLLWTVMFRENSEKNESTPKDLKP